MERKPIERPLGLAELHDRFRRIALRVGLVGLVLVGAAFFVSVITGGVNAESFLEAGIYTVILSAIALSAHRDFRVRLVLHAGLTLLFLAYWAFTYTEFRMGDIAVDTLLYPIFIPVFIAIGLDYRLQLALAPLHGVMIWLVTPLYVEVVPFGAETLLQQQILTATMACFCALLIVLLALVQISRQKTDERLVAVIIEKNRLATTDPLTGLLNRRAFLEMLESSAGKHPELTLAFIDLNSFKPLNDQFGHAAGDAVLKAIAARLESHEAVISAARPGGDEFAAIIDPDLSAEQTDKAIAAIYASLVHDVSWQDRLIHVGVSLGYAATSGAEGDIQACLGRADTAMRRVKAAGGGFGRYTAAIDAEAISASRLAISFPPALAAGHIRPALQPIVDARSKEIVCHELLARWTSSTGMRQPAPGEFIPVAEKLGLMNELLWTTLDQALKLWPHTSRSVSINVSPGQLQTHNFVPKLRRIIDRHGFSAGDLVLEITENVALRNLNANAEALQEARRAGMKIALDDFGTGYSSLSLLSRLPLDILKIDHSLVHAASRNGDSTETAILRGALRLSHELGLVSCAEGVSSEEMALQMKIFGADQIQGFWVGRPQLVTPGSAPVKLAS
jgi:diguanylate cyclase (GGDEF)-like protein